MQMSLISWNCTPIEPSPHKESSMFQEIQRFNKVPIGNPLHGSAQTFARLRHQMISPWLSFILLCRAYKGNLPQSERRTQAPPHSSEGVHVLVQCKVQLKMSKLRLFHQFFSSSCNSISLVRFVQGFFYDRVPILNVLYVVRGFRMQYLFTDGTWRRPSSS